MITLDKVREFYNKRPKKICLYTTHKGALKKTNNKYFGTFNIPFGESIKKIFPFKLYLDKKHPDAYWRFITTQTDYDKIEAWIKEQGSRVFLRDCLDCSIALSFNYTNTKKTRTEIGNLEYQAKYKHNELAITKLSEEMTKTIQSIPLYQKADFIAAVPPSPNKDIKKYLPYRIASKCSTQINKPNITSNFKALNPKKSIKTLPLNEKWNIWEKTETYYDGELKGKKVILIDDKYQSGTSIQYIAMKLQKAGAMKIYGLCIVKTLKDTDNT